MDNNVPDNDVPDNNVSDNNVSDNKAAQTNSVETKLQQSHQTFLLASATPTRINIIKHYTKSLLSMFDADDFEKNLSGIGSAVLDGCNDELELHNSVLPTDKKMRKLRQLLPIQIAEIMLASGKIIKVSLDEDQEVNDPDKALLCVYQTDGPMKGTYQDDEFLFYRMICEISYDFSPSKFQEVLKLLQTLAKTRQLCRHKDLIAVNNGIFDYKNKKLLPFDPKYVFLAKSFVNYNEQAQNFVIHNDEDNTDWDIESWMKDLNDDPDVVELLWKILGALIRPNVRWNKAAWFYSEKGNNGKGTFCKLARGLCGKGTCVSLALKDMGVDFMLEPLLHATAIITDENDVGTFIEKAANLKAIITNDAIMVNRKFKRPLTFHFYGFMIQCLNEMPKIRDKSESFYRRQIFILFDKCFTGKERTYIKDDYLGRSEVLEYVLYKVLNMDYYELNVPESCKKALEEYKEYVDPIRAFLTEMMPQFVWDMLPWGFLYDLYCAWYKRNNPGFNNGIVNKQRFIKDVKQLIKDSYSDEWSVTGDNGSRPGNRMCVPEPLIYEYNLERWMNLMYKNDKDSLRACVPVLVAQYRGLYRNGSNVVTSVPGDTSNM